MDVVKDLCCTGDDLEKLLMLQNEVAIHKDIDKVLSILDTSVYVCIYVYICVYIYIYVNYLCMYVCMYVQLSVLPIEIFVLF